MLSLVTTALHHSRRIQARRILRQHAHLIAPSAQSFPQLSDRNSGSQELMPIDYKPEKAKPTTETPTRHEMGWLAAIAVAFLIVHIIAWTVGMHASAHHPKATGSEAISSLYD